MIGYGAAIERGVVLEVSETGYRVKSTTRDGIITPEIPAVNANTFAVGDKVFFFLFEDGSGGVISAFA